jgi:hypothetical protein
MHLAARSRPACGLNLFVQAELRRGEAVAEAFGQVQDYSLMRHKAAVEVQMSESLLAAEEEMMTLAKRPARKPRHLQRVQARRHRHLV